MNSKLYGTTGNGRKWNLFAEVVLVRQDVYDLILCFIIFLSCMQQKLIELTWNYKKVQE